MGGLELALCRADAPDLGAIFGLIDAARAWLRTKNTGQWAQPWPSEEDRCYRIQEALRAGQTWTAWDAQTPAATITLAESSGVWPGELLADPAVYVSRVVVS